MTREKPDWLTFPRTLSLLFPRLSGTSIQLSRFDTALLSSFEDWTRPVEAVDRRTVDVLFAFGDLLIEYRARQWTRSGSLDPALEARREAAGPALGRHSYRLTERGRRLLAGDLSAVSDAPALEVGGATAYAPERAWLVREEGDAWSWTRAGA